MLFEKFYRSIFYDFYHGFYYSILLISAIVGMLYFNRSQKPYKWISALLMFTLVSEVTSKYISFFPNGITSIVTHISIPLEFFFYVRIYQNFLESKKWNIILTWSVVIFLLAEIINTIYFQQLDQTPTNMLILESILLVFLSLRLFLHIRETRVFENVTKAGVFWFNSAVLIYYSFNILIWGFHSLKVYQLKNPPAIMYQLLLLFSGMLYFIYATSIIIDNIYNRKIQKTS